jgi:hypothetical protein
MFSVLPGGGEHEIRWWLQELAFCLVIHAAVAGLHNTVDNSECLDIRNLAIVRCSDEMNVWASGCEVAVTCF